MRLSASGWIGLVTTSVALAFYVIVGGVQFLFGAYYVLGPVGPDGCWGVVREADGWPGAVGRIYAVPTLREGDQVGIYSGDDGYGPMSHGTYDFTISDGSGC